MESNGGQQRRSTESVMAQEGTESGRIKRGRKSTGIEESTGDVPKKVKKKKEIQRIHVKRDRKYSGEKVMEFLAVLRKRLHNANMKHQKVLRTNKNMRARNMAKMQKHIKTASILKLRMSWCNKRYKKMMDNWKIKMQQEREKYKKFRVEDLKLMRKQEWNRVKHYWEVPNDKTNPRHYDLITWARLYSKIELARQRTELKSYEIMLLLWISAHKEGEARSKLFISDLGFKRSKIKSYSKRLIEFNLVRMRKEGCHIILELTERGRGFVIPIVQFVKKEHQHAKKRKRIFVRDRVSAAETTSSIHDGELQVQS
jgi:hypothetical protein